MAIHHQPHTHRRWGWHSWTGGAPLRSSGGCRRRSHRSAPCSKRSSGVDGHTCLIRVVCMIVHGIVRLEAAVWTTIALQVGTAQCVAIATEVRVALCWRRVEPRVGVLACVVSSGERPVRQAGVASTRLPKHSSLFHSGVQPWALV